MANNYYSNHRPKKYINVGSRLTHNKFNFSYLLIFILIVIIFTINILPRKPKKTQVKGAATETKINLAIPNLPKIDNNISTIPKLKPDSQKPYFPAKYVILIDADNSYPLYQKNDQDRVPIASITKIMTAILSLEQYDINRVVTVPRSAAIIPGSRMNLYTNEKITIENLLYGLMLNSGNDAAYTLASLDPKSKNDDIKPFVNKMNQKASLLGLNNTYFYCPAGLDDKGYSTAHDLAFLTAYALKNPVFAKLVKTPEKIVTSVDSKYSHSLKNSNRLVTPGESLYMPTSIGVKTGWTELAGHSLVAAATQDNHTLISVVLNTYSPAKPESARINKQLLDWGFANFTWPN